MSDKKPQVKLENLSGNIFAVQGAAVEALRKAGQRDKIKEMRERVTSSGSYDNALCVIMEYVDFSDGDARFHHGSGDVGFRDLELFGPGQ